MHGGGASKWDMKEALLSRAKVMGAPSAKGRAPHMACQLNAVQAVFGPPSILK